MLRYLTHNPTVIPSFCLRLAGLRSRAERRLREAKLVHLVRSLQGSQTEKKHDPDDDHVVGSSDKVPRQDYIPRLCLLNLLKQHSYSINIFLCSFTECYDAEQILE